MNKICWKGRAFKALSFGKNSKKAGRNFSGSITIFHRGGGSKKLLRRIDFQRKNLARGFIERIEYDPNRTARIALVRWSNIKLIDSVDKHAQALKCGVDFYGKGEFAMKSPSKIPLGDEFSSAGYSSDTHFRRPMVEKSTMVDGDPRLPGKQPLSNLQDNDHRSTRVSLSGSNSCFSTGKVVGLTRLQQSSGCSRLKAPRLLLAEGTIKNRKRSLSYSQFEQNVMYNSALIESRTSLSVQNQLARDGGGTHELGYSEDDQAIKYSIESRSKAKSVGPKGPSWRLNRGESAFSYILASAELRQGDEVLNIETGPTDTAISSQTKMQSQRSDPKVVHFLQESSRLFKRVTKEPATRVLLDNMEHVNQKSGISLPLWLAPIGSVVHNIELYPGGGGKLARAAGASAQLVQKPLTPIALSSLHQRVLAEAFDIDGASDNPFYARALENAPMERSTAPEHTEEDFFLTRGSPKVIEETENPIGFSLRPSSLCTIRLPSGKRQLIDLRCRATIGCVSNIDHRARMLTKAGQSRWLGIRPVVRGVAMNPIDHPHGGGEGRTKGGRPSVSPWGKPAKRARRSNC
jgi:ribosomal protein L2